MMARTVEGQGRTLRDGEISGVLVRVVECW